MSKLLDNILYALYLVLGTVSMLLTIACVACVITSIAVGSMPGVISFATLGVISSMPMFAMELE